jgi:acyl-CoA synthetase (AMP-forming)/AMP-acid ligase II
MPDDRLPAAIASVPEAVAWWARTSPAAVALVDIAGREVTYGQLYRAIGHFAARLAAWGTARGNRVLLAVPDGIPSAFAKLAAMSSAIAVPVDAEHSTAEASEVLAAVAPRGVVVQRGRETAYRARAGEIDVPVLEIDMAEIVDPGSADESPTLPAAGDLAMILLTSGTTERPRRVPVAHGTLFCVCAEGVRVRRLTPRDRYLSVVPGSFVVAVSRLAEAVMSGGSVLVTTGADVVRRPADVRDLRPTWTWMGPALLEAILAAAVQNPAFSEWPLRSARVGGANVTPDLIARGEALWGLPILNGYGTTETLGYITSEEDPESIPRKPRSVGLARSGIEIVVRDGSGAPLPPGTTGEITVRGEHVFPGYLDDAEATAAAFFPGGWYRTGDLGSLDAEGYLVITGRVRELINRGGEKIAPQEVDDAVLAHPAVADAAAFGVPDPRLGEEVAAAVVLRPGATVTERALRRWVATRLSPHKVPRRIWFVDALPRTGSSKVQRGVLTDRFGRDSPA